MSSGCGDILSLEDMKTAKKHQTFEAEVITGHSGGVSSGAEIDFATNAVTSQTQKTMPKIMVDAESAFNAQIAAHEVEHDNQMQSFENDFDSRLAGMAFTRVGTFTAGATLTDMRQTLLWEVSQGGDGHEYGWTGSFGSSGKVVNAGATPYNSGGISAGAWVDRSVETLASELADVVSTSVIGSVSAERIATFSAMNKASVFSKLQQFSKTKVCRVLHCGTSIANSSASATKQFLGELKSTIGDSGNKTQHLGRLGGSYTEPYLGWYKQPFGGFALTRSRGDSSSQTIKFQGVFDEFVLRYSTELDGGSFDVYLDGSLISTINCNGTQSYGNEYVYGFQGYYDRKFHTIEIHAPASGYAYIETLDMNMNYPGVHILDASLGGSSIRDMLTLRGTQGNQVQGVEIIGNNGIDSAFNNISSRFKPDLIVSTYTVNDSGAGIDYINNTYKPALERIVNKTKENGIPLLLIVEMGGHYSLPNYAQYSAFKEARKAILSYRNEPHVTVIDWHDLSGMNTTDTATLERLAYRYYAVTNLNVNAGTFGGDFIHPNNAGYSILSQALYSLSGINSSGYQGKPDYFFDEKSKNLTSIPNLSSVGSYQKTLAINGLTRTITNEIGRVYDVMCIGKSLQVDSSIEEPLYYAANEFSYGVDALNDYIVSAGTINEFGYHRNLSNYGFYVLLPAEVSAQSSAFTLTMIVGPGTTSIRINDSGNSLPLKRKIRGIGGLSTQDSKTEGKQIINTSDFPIVAHCTIDSYYGNPYFVISGDIYAAYLTPTDFACITEKKISKAKFLKPSVFSVNDIKKSETIKDQLYLEVVNGKTIEKICIGGEVLKPLDTDAKIKALYRLQNRADVKNARMTLEGTLTTNGYDEKIGGYTVSTAQNPQRFKSDVTFSSTDASKVFTISGVIPDFVGCAIYLHNASTNTYVGLNADGTWTNYGTSHNSAPDLTSNFRSYRGMPIAITLTLPDATVLGADTWSLYAAMRGKLATSFAGYFSVCEGSSATV